MPDRLPPPDRASISEEISELVALTERDGRAPGTIELLAHAPTLLGPFLGWAAALARNGALAPRHHEILALRIAHLCRSNFEFVEHRQFALEAGMSAEEIDAIRTHPDDDRFSESELALLDATDELHHEARVSEATYERLAGHFGPDQLVEIPMVVGQYTMLSMLTGLVDMA
jgi:4-carboxymuconolactone decarboxylase